MEASRPEPSLFFPPAAQPDLVRAAQKDDAYAGALAEAVGDAVRRLLGPAAALAWAREVRLAADLLYHGLTTGRGLATLGEEYCDLLQATAGGGGGRGGRGGADVVAGPPPGAVRRGVLALLKAVGPYAAARAGAAAARAAALEAAAEDGEEEEEEEEAEEEERRRRAVGEASSSSPPPPPPPPLTTRARAAALALYRSHLAPALPTLTRAHLAAFYLTGAYYSAAHRATGVRHVFIGRSLGEGRPSFGALGVFLLVQLGVSGALAARRRWGGGGGGVKEERGDAAAAAAEAVPDAAAAAAAARLAAALPPGVALSAAAAAAAAAARAGTGPPVVLTDAGVPLAPGEVEASARTAAASAPAASRCPLCLGPRAAPTATPCGHVFCWGCIGAWGVQKAECPLCRAGLRVEELVRVVGGGF